MQQNQRVAVIAKNTLQWYASKNNAFKKFTVSDYSVGKAPMQLQFTYNEKGKRMSEQFNEFMKNLRVQRCQVIKGNFVARFFGIFKIDHPHIH